MSGPCFDYETLLRLQEGDVSSTQVADNKKHIFTCERCQNKIENLKDSWSALELLETVHARESFNRIVRERVLYKQSTVSTITLYRVAAVCAAAVLVLALSIGIYIQHYKDSAQSPNTSDQNVALENNKPIESSGSFASPEILNEDAARNEPLEEAEIIEDLDPLMDLGYFEETELDRLLEKIEETEMQLELLDLFYPEDN